MILTLVGISYGTLDEAARRARGVGADIVVRPPGTSLIAASSSPMSEGLLPFFMKQPHVTFATGTMIQPLGGFDSLSGIDLAQFNKLSGGFRFVKGRAFQNDDDVIVDEYYAREKNLGVGSTIQLMNHTWRVSGIFESGKLARICAKLDVLCDFAATTCWAQSTAEIFSRLDQAAQSFVGATAGIRVTTHTGVIDEDETQVGTVAVKRSSPNEMQFLINFTGQDAQAIALRGRTLQIYYPKLNTVREYDVGKYKDLAQKLILLGFGMPGRELAANYDVSNLGGERVQSQDSVHLQLTPRAPEVLKQLSRVDLWISLKTNCPVQQKFYMPGGDYRLATYSDVKINPPLPAAALDLPKAAKRERMN